MFSANWEGEGWVELWVRGPVGPSGFVMIPEKAGEVRAECLGESRAEGSRRSTMLDQPVHLELWWLCVGQCTKSDHVGCGRWSSVEGGWAGREHPWGLGG